MINKNTPSPFGTLLGYAPGGVGAYSSDYDSASEKDYPGRSSYRSYLDGIYMGYKWQCVEFARRWMYINKSYIFDDVAMAYEIFKLRSIRDLKTKGRLPLNAFRNGCCRHPEPGCLLIWDEGGDFEETGHVAVVTAVFPDAIRIAEQNLNHHIWPEGQNWSRELKAKTTGDGEYWIQSSFSDAAILGWVIQTDDDSHAEILHEPDKKLYRLQAKLACGGREEKSSWLNMANEDEAAYVEMMGGHKLSSVDEDCALYFTLSQTAEKELIHATNELHELFMHATDYVLENEKLLKKFNLPESILPKIRQSWENRLNQLITSRFDFSMSEQGLKVYEYNCDSASCYMECGKIQGKWASYNGVKEGSDPGKNLLKGLVKAWRKSHAQGMVHILRDNDPEEKYHALFMQESITAAGITSKIIADLSELTWNEQGDILDNEGNKVEWIWKTWSWETALDQIRDEQKITGDSYEPEWHAGKAPRLSDVLLNKKIMVFEPLWTLIPSNKAILAVLWSLFPNHPLLLNTDFKLNKELKQSGYVTKPIVGRGGQNIELFDGKNNILEENSGRFNSRNRIYQQLFPLPLVKGYYTQVSTFTAAGKYAGSCLRVDKSMIISQSSDCMALRFISDEDYLKVE